MNILGIETSCDETAAAVVCNGMKIVASVVSTQIPTHRPYLGVVPELASREHLINVNAVIAETIKKAKVPLHAIAVTVGPGLIGSLLVGRMTAEAMGWVRDLPVLGVNHIEGHLLSPILTDPTLKPPFLGLVVSGGHTDLIYAKSWGNYALLGRTRDDAAGEAFDKVAKMLGLGYPGGPVIDRLSRKALKSSFRFPRPWLPGTWDFSFSGLKTAVLYKISEKKKWTSQEKSAICSEFQSSVVDVLVGKTIAAAKALKCPKIVVGGGVAANSQLRMELERSSRLNNLKLVLSPLSFCSDNAAMIASAGYFQVKFGKNRLKNQLKVDAQLHLPFFSGKTLPTFAIPSN